MVKRKVAGDMVSRKKVAALQTRRKESYRSNLGESIKQAAVESWL